MQETRHPETGDTSIIMHDQNFEGKDVLGAEDRCIAKMSANSMMNEASAVHEIEIVERRAADIRDDIKELKRILEDLNNKDDLAEEDRLQLKDTQATVLFKIGELNEITRNLQRIIGLGEQRTNTFLRAGEKREIVLRNCETPRDSPEQLRQRVDVSKVNGMKRRKSCTLSQSQSLRDARTRSSSSSAIPQRIQYPSPRRGRPRKRDEALRSLESLFDLGKPFQLRLEDYPYYRPPLEERRDADEDEVGGDEAQPDSDELARKALLQPASKELDTHVTVQEEEIDEPVEEPEPPTTEEPESEPIEEPPILSEIEEDNASNSAMAENEDPTEMSSVSQVQDNQSNATQLQANPSQAPSKSVTVNSVAEERSVKSSKPETATIKSSLKSARPPEHDLPPGVGEGILGSGKHRESVISSLPVTESGVVKDMAIAEGQAACIREEIKEMKKILYDIQNKEDLTEEDSLLMKDTQAKVMQKIAELNEITRKLQRTIGLCDPSTKTFAKMFEMLPLPHTKCSKSEMGDDLCCGPFPAGSTMPRSGEKFAFPQIEHPEDKLPRVIICGDTEEDFPKIVVADSCPKRFQAKCLAQLPGRLNEALCMQEKLVRENADLEGGKFILEQELLQKDNAVDCLQRKVCGLQAEMRLVVRENSELSRKICCLEKFCSEKPRPPCPPKDECKKPCPPTGAQWSDPCAPKADPCPPKFDPCPPRSDPYPASQQRYPNSPKSPPCPSPTIDLSCRCKVRERERAEAQRGGCGAPRSPCGTPRLAGGASRGDNDCFSREMQRNGGPTSNCQQSPSPPSSQRNVCPAEIEERLAAYGDNTKYLGEQLSCIETEVRTLQSELLSVQRERQQLEQQRKLLECAGPCATCPCSGQQQQMPAPMRDNAANEPPESNSCAMQQLRDLREQYARLQDDYKSKLCEVSRLRTDAEALKREAREAKDERERFEIKLIDAQERLRVIECERNSLLGAKEQLVEQEQQLQVAKQRFREAQDEVEELRTMIRDQAAQLDDYRNKYLQAQQIVEEQRRQLDLMEMDNARMNENVTLEIGRVKSQFQEKLAELAPLPDILKQTQIKLQETQQLKMMAEHNCEDLSRELLGAKDKMDALNGQISDLQRELQNLQDERDSSGGKTEELEKRNGELRNENERLKSTCNRLEEAQAQLQKRVDEKQHEIVQLTAMLEQVREDSARQVARTKERCEAIKRSMQAQISDFEIQLAQCRAAAKTAQKERDEIRQKMQGQIGNLNEALQQAQGRIRSLQGHVDYLKVSYSTVFGGQGQGETTNGQKMGTESPTPGYDSCDCTY